MASKETTPRFVAVPRPARPIVACWSVTPAALGPNWELSYKPKQLKQLKLTLRALRDYCPD